jgi:predicted metal-dependent hydrolase
MMSNDVFGYIMMVFVLGVILKIYLESDTFNLRCIISTVDGNEYCVRERNKIQDVADLLAKITVKLKNLVSYMNRKYPTRDNVKRMVDNFNPKKITETLPTSKFTAYSENKGEKMAFCVTKKKNGMKLIDENTLTFVAIHELAHIATKSIGHKDEFWNNFKFLLENAKTAGIYNPVDYKKNPKEYCGMKITDNPYYDL